VQANVVREFLRAPVGFVSFILLFFFCFRLLRMENMSSPLFNGEGKNLKWNTHTRAFRAKPFEPVSYSISFLSVRSRACVCGCSRNVEFKNRLAAVRRYISLINKRYTRLSHSQETHKKKRDGYGAHTGLFFGVYFRGRRRHRYCHVSSQVSCKRTFRLI